MTREEAISLLRRYRRYETYVPSKKLFGWKRNHEFDRAVYERHLVLELIDRIKKSNLPPIEVVRAFYYEMDDVVCSSYNRKTWAFASTMENCASDILHYLREKEKMNEQN